MNILVRTAVAALLLAIVAYGVGALFGHDWGWSLLAAAYLILLLHHARHLHLLSRWASSGP